MLFVNVWKNLVFHEFTKLPRWDFDMDLNEYFVITKYRCLCVYDYTTVYSIFCPCGIAKVGKMCHLMTVLGRKPLYLFV